MLLNDLIAANKETLSESVAMLKDITDAAYTAITAPFAASIGKHMRHISDHYLQLFNGIADGKIDYDARVRNESVEENRSAMIELLSDISAKFSGIQPDPKKTVSVVLSVDEYSKTPAVESTLARELVFLQSHTTHHCAIISGILKIQGLYVPENFGIAASTRKYDQRQAAH